MAGWTGEGGCRQQLGDRIAHMEEIMSQKLIQGGAFGGIRLQDACDEGARLVGYLHVLWEAIGVHANPAVGGLDVIGLERRLSY